MAAVPSTQVSAAADAELASCALERLERALQLAQEHHALEDALYLRASTALQGAVRARDGSHYAAMEAVSAAAVSCGAARATVSAAAFSLAAARVPAAFERIADSRPAAAVRHFAGGALPTTILSCCSGALLPLLGARGALPLRATCAEARGAIAALPWREPRTTVPVARAPAWRACFPAATAATLGAADWLPAATLAALTGVQELRVETRSLQAEASAALPGARVALGRTLSASFCIRSRQLVRDFDASKSNSAKNELFRCVCEWLAELALGLHCGAGRVGAGGRPPSLADLVSTAELLSSVFAPLCSFRALENVCIVAWHDAETRAPYLYQPGAAFAHAAAARTEVLALWTALGLASVCLLTRD